MSTFLGFESYLVPLGSTAQNILDTLKTAITAYGWQVLRSTVPTTAMATSTIATYANAVDGVSTTVAGNTAAVPVWVGVQTNTAFTPTKMYLQSHVDGPTTAPMTFTLDYSDNGTSWTTLQTWPSETMWLAYERRVYTVSGATAHNYWRLNITAKQSGQSTLYVNEWMLEDASHNLAVPSYFMDIIPPVTESIGSSLAKESIRIQISEAGTTISIRPQQELLQAIPQLYVFDTPVAGAVTLSITVGGSTVSFVGDAAKSEYQNGRGLYEALKNSTDANFLAWNWTWTGDTVGYTGVGYIQATKKVPSPNITITSSNISARTRGSYQAPSMQGCGFAQWATLTTDVTNGFIYYLQVNSRGLALATKTNAAFYGPVHMCYANNADALAQVPVSELSDIPCTPIELIVGTDDVAASASAFGRFSHWWGVANGWSNVGQNDLEVWGWNANIWTKHLTPYWVQDQMSGNNAHLGSTTVTLRSEGMFSGADTASAWNVHRMGLVPDDNWQYCWGYNNYARCFCPGYPATLDWYKYYGTLTDEQLVFAATDDFTATLTAPVLSTDTTITVDSTAGWPTAGYLVIDNEAIQYTGVTSTSFTGCTRAKYATQPFSYFTGGKVYIGSWLVKINTGLLFAGYVKPS